GGNRAVLLSALKHAPFRLIALVTPREAEGLLAEDPDAAELFSRIDVPEPSAEVALPLLNHYASALAERFNLQIEADAILQSAHLTAHYIWNDQLPGKALKVLYRACEDLDYDRTHAGRAARPVTADDIVRVVAERSGVPEETLRGVGAKLDYEGALAADI